MNVLSQTSEFPNFDKMISSLDRSTRLSPWQTLGSRFTGCHNCHNVIRSSMASMSSYQKSIILKHSQLITCHLPQCHLFYLRKIKKSILLLTFRIILSSRPSFQLELPNLVTLSLLAWGSATERELRLWSVLVRV